LVKPALQRAQKYAAKFDSTVIANRYTAVKTLATDAQEIQAGALVQMETQVKTILEADANVTSPTMIPSYLAFARQCYARSRKYGGVILKNEVQHIAQTWFKRGFNATTLVHVASLFGVSINSPS
jgi:hypothetical protein